MAGFLKSLGKLFLPGSFLTRNEHPYRHRHISMSSNTGIWCAEQHEDLDLSHADRRNTVLGAGKAQRSGIGGSATWLAMSWAIRWMQVGIAILM
jgi:hypothetical protein